jgi:hypothetical protein
LASKPDSSVDTPMAAEIYVKTENSHKKNCRLSQASSLNINNQKSILNKTLKQKLSNNSNV